MPVLSRGWRIARSGLLLLASLGVARCTEPPSGMTPPGTTSPAAAHPAVTAAPAAQPAAQPAATPGTAAAAQAGPTGDAVDAGSKPVLFNDPPARPDTPLCGHQAQEANAIGAALQGPRVTASGICASFACYDPLTATYIGADGYRHVCR